MQEQLRKFGNFNKLPNGNIILRVNDELNLDETFNEVKNLCKDVYELKYLDKEKRLINLFKLTKLSDMPAEFFKSIIDKIESGEIDLS